jgi:peptidoglycan/LPS O-acetylase OafA/YrhL
MQADQPVASHLPGLDGLRAVSVMLVISYHFIGGLLLPREIGKLGVEIFFVISGGYRFSDSTRGAF